MWWSFAAAEAGQADFLRPAFIAYLRARGTDDADYGNAELIFGELIGNVVRHAPGPIAITVRWNREAPVLVVADRGRGFLPVPPMLPDTLLSESGRGLFLVNAFGSDLLVEQNPTGGSRVSVVLPIRRKKVGVTELSAVAGPSDVLALAAATLNGMTP